ncbi:MAG: N-acetyltransferase [Chloroflexi bacterium]|nr:MAG: N-acetyltransferase [Chloroflexota bacterium]
MTVEVKKVQTKADYRVFFEFPWRHYANDPYWTPVLLSMRHDILDKTKNPSWEYMEGDYYVAWRGDTPVGTIAAFVNHRHNEYHNEHIAWFGFFETINDSAVASALLQTALNWAKERGYHALRGPQSFTTHEECGLLISGFERPVMLMPYNYPYYQQLVEGAGFHKVMDVHSFHRVFDPVMLEEGGQFARLNRVVERMKTRHNIKLRPINRKNLKADFKLFKDIYNEAWKDNWGFVPFTDRELDALVKNLSQFFDPDLAIFAEVDGETVGFVMGVPDFNQVLKAAYPRPGTPEIFTLLKALWHWKIRPKITWMRIPLMGIKAEYRKYGIVMMLVAYLVEQNLKHGVRYQHLDAGWVLETNHDLIGILEKAGMEIHRTHRFYEKSTTAI